ncbi:hypothetical protein VNO78_04344 [Psophocarpus tetragonolobus]|uniref:Hydrophobic seed protein domain-containing protein n=1 Tax=Psophocarpus tetragonolobus TaxID=3891 RepID=A0AAN9T2X8_PSOTE
MASSNSSVVVIEGEGGGGSDHDHNGGYGSSSGSDHDGGYGSGHDSGSGHGSGNGHGSGSDRDGGYGSGGGHGNKYHNKCPDLHSCTTIKLPPYKAANNCCPLLKELDDLEASLCLCNIVREIIGGIVGLARQCIVKTIFTTCGRDKVKFNCD